jgi:hypothetical protein
MNQMTAPREFDSLELPPGTRLLNGQYQILEPLQQGGFAMTYVARDSLDRNVVIKECLPAGLCCRRNGQVWAISPALDAQFAAMKQQFICEARGMAKLNHPYVVAVHQVFEENNTAYMALDYVDGIDLITVQEDEPHRLTPDFLDRTLREALRAVRHIHSKSVLHRDIAPDNLRVDNSDRITLIDFGAAETRNPGIAFSTAALKAVKDGYSPPEFYLVDADHDFSSDLYSLGATFYLLITGEIPPSGRLRHEAVMAGKSDPYQPLVKGNWDCGYPILVTIDRALQLDMARRPQSADDWLAALDAAPRQRPAVKAPLLVDQDLDAVVSKLVKEVNRNLTAEDRAPDRPELSRRAPAAKAPAPAKAAKPGTWVDLYGNLITDVASWLAEQERIAAAPVDDIPDEPTEPVIEADPALSDLAERPVRKSLFSGFLARYRTRRPQSFPI